MTSEPEGGTGVGILGPRNRRVTTDEWIPRLFRIRSWDSVLVVAAGFSVGTLALGGLITAALHAAIPFDQGMVYFRRPIFYTYTLWLFVFLWVLGQWSQGYVTMWDDLSSSFDTSDAQYWGLVDGGLSLAYRLDIPFALFVPYQLVIELLSPFSLSSAPTPETFVFEGFQIVLNFLFVVILYLLFVHLVLTKQVLSLPLSNLYSATRELEPLAEFSVSLAVKYFVNLALVAFTVYFVLDANVSQYLLTVDTFGGEALTQWERLFSLAMFGSYLVVGLLVFFVPIRMIHARLREAKRAKLVELDEEYDRLIAQFLDEEKAEELPVRVEQLDQIRNRTAQVSTWPFQLPSLLRVLISSLAPVAVFVVNTLTDASL